MSSASASSTESASTCSDSDSSMSTTSSASDAVSSTSTVSCFFDPSTCKRQSFSVPEKILYYMAKNCTNAETYQKLVETCKYFFKVNPVIIVPIIKCYGHKWYACYDLNRRMGFKYDQTINFKIWVTHKFDSLFGDVSQVIPRIYKNDATVVYLQDKPLKFDQLLFLAGKAEKLTLWSQLIKYENGKTVQLEDIVKNLSKLKSFTFASDNGDHYNTNTASKLLEIEHFKNITYLRLRYIPETLNVETMFNFIIKNKQTEVDLYFREEISDACKDLIQQYSNLLGKEEGCNSRIRFDAFETTQTSTSEGDSSDFSFDSSDISFDSSDDEIVSDVDDNEE